MHDIYYIYHAFKYVYVDVLNIFFVFNLLIFMYA